MLIIVTLVAIIVLTTMLFLSRYSLVYVKGSSMEPTYTEGKILLLDETVIDDFRSKAYVSYKDTNDLLDRVFVICPEGDGRRAVKRLNFVSHTGNRATDCFFYFTGDNAERSYDSRDYGFLTVEKIAGEIVTFKEAFIRFIKP